MEELLASIIQDELLKMHLKDKMTGFLVKKRKRGTYQAFDESGEIEKKMIEELTTYVKSWFRDELVDGELRKMLTKELLEQTKIELVRRGFTGIL
jgi:hypothetical protein